MGKSIVYNFTPPRFSLLDRGRLAAVVVAAVVVSVLEFEAPGGHHLVEVLAVHVLHVDGLHHPVLMAQEVHHGVLACTEKNTVKIRKKCVKMGKQTLLRYMH